MITKFDNDYITESGDRINVAEYSEFAGLSTDTKPTNVANGSTFMEIDTGKVFMYDAENELWKEL